MNNKKRITFLILGIILAVALAYIILLRMGFFNNNNGTNTNNGSVVEVGEKKDVLDLIGLTDKGYSRLDDYQKQIYNVSGDNYIDYSFYNIAKIFMDLKSGNYKVSDLEKDQLNRLIFNYATSHSILLENFDSNGEANHPCNKGTGSCLGINVEDYKKIAKLYGLSDNPSDVLNRYNDYYILDMFATVDNPHEIDDKIDIKYVNGDIEVKYDFSIKPTQDYNSNGSTFNKNITYTFKKNSDKNYYLSNIIVEEK